MTESCSDRKEEIVVAYLAVGLGGLMVLEQIRQYLDDKHILVFSHDLPQNVMFKSYLGNTDIKTYFTSVNKCEDILIQRGVTHLVSMCYRNIVKDDILDLVDGRAINYHPSLLPMYQGVYSLPWAIINGDAKTGVTWHYMTSQVDRGNIIEQLVIPIEPDDTAYHLYNKCISKAAESIHSVWKRSICNSEPGYKQMGIGNYNARQLPHDGIINPNWPDEKVERFIRAMWFPPYEPALLKTYEGSMPIQSLEQYIQVKNINRTVP